ESSIPLVPIERGSRKAHVVAIAFAETREERPPGHVRLHLVGELVLTQLPDGDRIGPEHPNSTYDLRRREAEATHETVAGRRVLRKLVAKNRNFVVVFDLDASVGRVRNDRRQELGEALVGP